ncbi:hypothetical protein NM688_g8846 [Phlebia brevispora]|uniref:Uncharacterized protein n=1 Tax=Phlebia brevispora TaxID=194682 RepID=A0ACC1RRQ0_9APHY|nr:hypothetical protein NM688_g8846 [Phlebia brevispora]
MQLPDFSGQLYQTIRNHLIEAGLSQQEAIDQLEADWTAQQEALVAAWDEQEAADAVARQQAADEQAQALATQKEAEEADRKEHEKKHPHWPPAELNTGIGEASNSETCISTWAMECLLNLKLVPLWYFRHEGVQEAKNEAMSAQAFDHDTFSLTRIGENIGVRPVTSEHPSKNAKCDRDLSLAEFVKCYHPFLRAISKASWGETPIKIHIEFFQQILFHPM